MNNMWSKMIGGDPDHKRIETDYYPTPWECTVALMDFLKLPVQMKIWECACGEGHITKVLEAIGHDVVGTDIKTGHDFLTVDCVDCDWIITNPPFSLSEQFIKRCIEHGKPFSLLLKSQYWHARKRLTCFRNYPPAYILPLTWRPDFLEGKRVGASLMDVMWVVWDGTHETRYIPLEKPTRRSER